MKLQTFRVSLSKDYDIAAAYAKGSGDLLFCIHGLGCNHAVYRHIEAQPVLQSCSFLVPDLYGSGSSGRSDQFSYSMEDQAEICAGLLREFTYERLHLVAHSMGGAIALLLPPHVLDSAQSFANVEGNLIAEDCFASREVAEIPFGQFEAEMVPKLHLKYDEYVSFDLSSPLAYHRSARSLVEWSDSGKLLRKFLDLRCRKSYFYGDKNRDHPTVSATRSVPQVLIERSGHFMMEDNPTDFYSELAKFIGPVA